MSRNESTFPFPDTDTETELHSASPTAYLLDELALHGHRPGQDEPDPRPELCRRLGDGVDQAAW
jgi:hypothetical protein